MDSRQSDDFLGRPSPLRISYALLILVAFFALMPAAFRSARLSLKDKENDVKDWLPSDFSETADLKWFASHFVGESFVVATWPGCTADDQRLKLLTEKLTHESESFDAASVHDPAMVAKIRRARQIGAEHHVMLTGDVHLDWGGQNEKWLSDGRGQWYYITPDGNLYRWDESVSGPAAAIRGIKKRLGKYRLDGQLITGFGSVPDRGGNSPFYNDPSLFTVPLFGTVQTGPTVVDRLAAPDGPLWPIDGTDSDRRETVARRLAMERLTGTLFAPAVPAGFDWSGPSIVDAAIDAGTIGRADPEAAIVAAQAKIDQIVDENFDGQLAKLRGAPEEVQSAHWYQVFDAAGLTPPPRLTAVVVTLTAAAKDHLGFALGRGVMDLPRGRLLHLADQSGLSAALPPSMAPPPFNTTPPQSIDGKPPLRLGGPPVDNVAIDEEGTVTLVRLVGYSLLLGIVLSYLCFRSVKITIMVFIVGGASALVSMAMVRWTGGRVDAVLMSMPSLVYVLGLSGAIHVVNYYRDEVRRGGEPGAAMRALRHAVMPCTLASFTTAIGLISLSTSNLAPISNFGWYSAIGVMATVGILLSYLPAALQTFKPEVPTEPDASIGHDDRLEGRLANAWASVGQWIAAHHAAVATGCIAVLIAAAVGLRDLKTSVQLLKLFDEDSRIIDDYQWLENNLGKLVPMEVVLRMPTDPAVADLDPLQRVEAVSRVRRVVHQSLGEPGLGVVGTATAADTFLPPLPEPSNRYSPVRAKFNREIAAAIDDLRQTDMLRIENEGTAAENELWRISLRVAALSDVDYGMFIATLRQSVAPVLSAYHIRESVVDRLGDKTDGQVLVIGAARPAPIDQTSMLTESEDGRRDVDHDAVLMASLGEILDSVPAERVVWRDVGADDLVRLREGDKFAKYLSRFDAVVWTGDGPLEPSDLATADSVVRMDQITEDPPVRVNLASGLIEDPVTLPQIAAIYTGVVPVIYKAQRTLLVSLTESIAMAFVLIAIVMFVLLNPGRTVGNVLRPVNVGYGVAAGMVSMIPNVFPVVFVFGMLCHLGVAIDIGTMMVASVAMGVAVDDTIHFLTWFRTNLDAGMNRVEAVIETYRRVGPAMTQTTLVGGLGLFVFALSTFTPTQRFGTLMLVMLATALVGDLILLPALLAGPLGRVFKPRSFGNWGPANEPASEPEPAHAPEPTQVDAPELPRLRVHYPKSETNSLRRAK